MNTGWKRALTLGGCLLALACEADTLTGRVVSVADGDTVTVLDAKKVQHKVLLSGIDATEKSQPFGQRSKAHFLGFVLALMNDHEFIQRTK
jgi:endonuclease YncB( thermonuclease family)